MVAAAWGQSGFMSSISSALGPDPEKLIRVAFESRGGISGGSARAVARVIGGTSEF